MHYVVKIVHVILLATVKYFYTPIYAFFIGLSFIETLLSLLAGGIFGFFVFYYISNILILLARYLKPVLIKCTPQSLLDRMQNWKQKRKEKRKSRKKFSLRNKLIVKLKTKYGMWGISLLTPIALSIPIGAFLLRKYYHNRKEAIPIMLLSIITEGIILCIVYWLILSKKTG